MKKIYSLILADYKNVLYFFPLIIVGIRGYKGTEVSLGKPTKSFIGVYYFIRCYKEKTPWETQLTKFQ